MPTSRSRELKPSRARRYFTIRIPIPTRAPYVVAGLVLAVVALSVIGQSGQFAPVGQDQATATVRSTQPMTGTGAASNAAAPSLKRIPGGGYASGTTGAVSPGTVAAAPAHAVIAKVRPRIRLYQASGHSKAPSRSLPVGEYPHATPAKVPASSAVTVSAAVRAAAAAKSVAIKPAARESERDHRIHYEVRRTDRPAATTHVENSHQRLGALPAKPCPSHAANHAAQVVSYGRPVHGAAGHMA